jgi:hypothetical protein
MLIMHIDFAYLQRKFLIFFLQIILILRRIDINNNLAVNGINLKGLRE